jgi:hypothetical protein
MDFTRQTSRTESSATQSAHVRGIKKGWQRLMQLASVVLLFSTTALVVAILFFVFFSGDAKPESHFVDNSKLQAVFLNNQQVYFGNITALNSKYITLDRIYYLQVNQQVQPDAKPSDSKITLVKLGCELHGPQDEMVINRDQVVFWENLKDDGKVAQAVAQFKQTNPNGLDCSAPTAKN